MRGWKRAACALLLVAFLGSRVEAFPFVDDPAVLQALETVNELLGAIERVELAVHLALERSIRGVVRDVGFPEGLFSEIQQTLSLMTGIRGELQELSCAFRFSARTGLLRDLYFTPRRICRREFETIWGAPPPGPDRELQEMGDYLGSLSTNLVTERVDAVESWRAEFPDMEQASARIRRSPGEASRDEAVALSGSALIANSNSGISTESLLLEELEASRERQETKRGLDLGRFVLLKTAGIDPFTEGGE
jgi:hypothetical protein